MGIFKDTIVEDCYVSDEVERIQENGEKHSYYMVGNYRKDCGVFSSGKDVPLLLDRDERRMIEYMDIKDNIGSVKYLGWKGGYDGIRGREKDRDITVDYLLEEEGLEGEVRLSLDGEKSPFESILNDVLDGKKILDTEDDYLFTDDPDFLKEFGLDGFSYEGIYDGLEDGSIDVKGENSEMLGRMLGKMRPKTMKGFRNSSVGFRKLTIGTDSGYDLFRDLVRGEN